MTATRQRLRQVSPERIARVCKALGDRAAGVRLMTDGTAVILTGDGEAILPEAGEGANEWDDVLQGSA